MTNENLELNTQATVSSEQSSEYSGDKPVDGNISTKWVSNYNNLPWIEIDLGTTYSINQIVLTWGTEYGGNYEIKAYGGSTWNLVETIPDGDGGVDDLSVSFTGQSVRISGLNQDTWTLWEIKNYEE